MSDLNDPTKVNDLIETLLAASVKGSKIKVLVHSESLLTLVVDDMPHDFRIEHDVVRNLWFLEG